MPVDDWRRPAPTARQRRNDLYIGLTAVAVAVFNVAAIRSAGMYVFGEPTEVVQHYGWAVAITLPLIWRRTYPATVTALIGVVFIAGQVLETQETQIASVALFTAIYSLGAWGPDREVVRWVRGLVIGSMFVWLAVSVLISWDEIGDDVPANASGPLSAVTALVLNTVLTNLLMFGFFGYFGEISWLAVRRQRQLQVQAEQLAAAQEQNRDQAVFGERVRIARELHDVVAHHVSVMGIQASAARRALDKDLGKARTALAAVEHSARTAVDELRRMLGALRATDTDPDRANAAGLDHLDELIARVREAGLTGQLAVYGEARPVPDSVSQAAYRIVQEAVTNTLKHAHASAVDVRVRYLSEELEIDVADDGTGGGPGGGGMGLIGMRERVAVHDGTIETGPRSGGGYRVRARLPLQRTMSAQS